MADENTYTTSRGKTVKFLSVEFMLGPFRASHSLPEPPKAKASRKARAKYQSDLTRAIQKRNLDFVRLVLLRGIKVDMPTDDQWIKDQERQFGVQAPVNSIERKLYYLETEVLGTIEDYKQIVLGTLRASGIETTAWQDDAASSRKTPKSSRRGR